MSLNSDPVKWAETVTKTKVRLILFIVVQFGFLIYVLWNLYNSIATKSLSLDFSFYEFLMSNSPIIVLGAILPSMYLYSMYRMVKIIKEKS